MEIFNSLFEALNKYGKKEMVLKLYDIMLKKHLNPTSQIHSIAMKIIEKNKDSGKKRNMNDNLKKLLSNAEKTTKFKKINFSRRTFRSRYYPNIYTENIKFYAFDTCIFCQHIINLESISLNLKEMNRDLSWTFCPNCKETLLPKLTVQFGEEINKKGDMKENTSNFDIIVLFSPYILKNNYSTIFGKNIGVKLDVHDLMMKYPSIYWNSLWYFKLNGLEYDFMQPYYYRLQEIGYKDLISWVEMGKTDDKEESDDSDEEEKPKRFDISKLKITSNRMVIK
jgi:ssDNA-binding Zn-finger/Zn-ribbon topoisomerase 1